MVLGWYYEQITNFLYFIYNEAVILLFNTFYHDIITTKPFKKTSILFICYHNFQISMVRLYLSFVFYENIVTTIFQNLFNFK